MVTFLLDLLGGVLTKAKPLLGQYWKYLALAAAIVLAVLQIKSCGVSGHDSQLGGTYSTVLTRDSTMTVAPHADTIHDSIYFDRVVGRVVHDTEFNGATGIALVHSGFSFTAISQQLDTVSGIADCDSSAIRLLAVRSHPIVFWRYDTTIRVNTSLATRDTLTEAIEKPLSLTYSISPFFEKPLDAAGFCGGAVIGAEYGPGMIYTELLNDGKTWHPSIGVAITLHN